MPTLRYSSIRVNLRLKTDVASVLVPNSKCWFSLSCLSHYFASCIIVTFSLSRFLGEAAIMLILSAGFVFLKGFRPNYSMYDPASSGAPL